MLMSSRCAARSWNTGSMEVIRSREGTTVFWGNGERERNGKGSTAFVEAIRSREGATVFEETGNGSTANTCRVALVS